MGLAVFAGKALRALAFVNVPALVKKARGVVQTLH